MKKFYTQKDICRLLNVTRETLRFYEKEGLIHPVINEPNQYRFYDDYQMYLVAECKRYQQNHFSIREIRSMLSSDTLEQYTERIGEKADFIEGQIRKLEKELGLIKEYSEKLKMIKAELNQPSVIETEEIVFAAQKTGTKLNLDAESLEACAYMNEHLAVTFMMAYMHEGISEWGYGLYRKFLDDEQIHELKLETIPAGRAVRMIIDCADVWEFDESLKAPLLDYCKENHLTPGDTFYMIHLVKIGEEQDMHRYFEAYLPL